MTALALERDTIPAQLACLRAEREIAHLQRLLAGGWMTEADQRRARGRLVRAMGKRVRAERAMERGD